MVRNFDFTRHRRREFLRRFGAGTVMLAIADNHLAECAPDSKPEGKPSNQPKAAVVQ
jgi:hypothetical protein